LAGKSSANKLNWSCCVSSDISHVSKVRYVGSAYVHQGIALVVDLGTPRALHPGTLEPQAETEYTVEQATK
jgi:hypothetical protein